TTRNLPRPPLRHHSPPEDSSDESSPGTGGGRTGLPPPRRHSESVTRHSIAHQTHCPALKPSTAAFTNGSQMAPPEIVSSSVASSGTAPAGISVFILSSCSHDCESFRVKRGLPAGAVPRDRLVDHPDHRGGDEGGD